VYRLQGIKRLNKSDVYPLPRIDEILQRLDGAQIFSKFDLRGGYHQIPMKAEDKVKTSFTCRYGTF
jgi:Reverse transcriptase (RNA-dependent DNA polymerase).